MADEWVSVRARLTKDPKTIAVSRSLSANDAFRQWLGVPVESLPRNVLVSVSVTAFIEVWAIANSRGIPDGNDILLLHCSFSTIDEIGQVPGLALAMQSVHWLLEEDVNGVSAVRLPNFKEYNRPAEERSEKEQTAREQNRDRQRRYRQRRNARNENVTLHNAPTARGQREDSLSLNSDRKANGSARAIGGPVADQTRLRSQRKLPDGRKKLADLSDLDWPHVLSMADAVGRKIPPLNDDDRRQWFKFSVLAETALSEDWLIGGADAVVNAKLTKRTKQAHLVSVLKGRAADRGYDKEVFLGMLGMVEIPDFIWSSNHLHIPEWAP